METVTEKTTVKNGGKPKDDPHIQLMKLRFWARFLISLLAFGAKINPEGTFLCQFLTVSFLGR